MALASAGVALPAAKVATERLEDFFPAVVDAMPDGINDAMLEACRRAQASANLDFSGVPEQRRISTAETLSGWRDMRSDRSNRKIDDKLRPALRLAGIEYGTGNGRSVNKERAWIELNQVRHTGQALVPAFGSLAGTTMQLLLCWNGPQERAILGWVENDSRDRPVIVCYFGTMHARYRRLLARECRRKNIGPIVVLDDAALAFLAVRGDGRFEAFMRIALPFTGINPYMPFVAGDVPEEMFYGRDEERRLITDSHGTSFIYGGRQLGKSALLRSAARQFETHAGQKALYADLRPLGMGPPGTAERLWPHLEQKLAGIGIRGHQGASSAHERVLQAIRSWLGESAERRLLLLLDECDNFFDADSMSEFHTISQLKDAMLDTDRRFKPVFAGLHQVQRFQNMPNQPLAHLGRPVVVGPLRPQAAFDLIVRPTEALGYRFESSDLVNRILAYCNYQPSLLQLFGDALVRHQLGIDRLDDVPPVEISEPDVDAIIASPELRQDLKSRFELTLDLDPRYRVIAYVVAHRAAEAGVDVSLDALTLRQDAASWWAQGFAGQGRDEFRALLDEMVGLGVLAHAGPARYRMRSSSVLRLLGPKETIEERLITANELEPPSRLAAAELRRALDDRGGRRSPVTEQRLADLLGDEVPQCRLVLGSEATCVENLSEAVSAAVQQSDRMELVQPRSRREYAAALTAPTADARQRLVLADLSQAADDSAVDGVLRACAALKASGPSTILVTTPHNIGVWFELFTRKLPLEAVPVELRRVDDTGLRIWAMETDVPFNDDNGRRRLMEVTGGWPALLEHAARLAASEHTQDRVLEKLAELLNTEAGAKWFVKATGITADPSLLRLWDTILEYGEAHTPEVFAAVCGDVHPKAAMGVECLKVLQALRVRPDGAVEPEPVLANAWQRVGRDLALAQPMTPELGAILERKEMTETAIDLRLGSGRCSQCGGPVVPGDSLCYTCGSSAW